MKDYRYDRSLLGFLCVLLVGVGVTRILLSKPASEFAKINTNGFIRIINDQQALILGTPKMAPLSLGNPFLCFKSLLLRAVDGQGPALITFEEHKLEHHGVLGLKV